MSKDDAKPIRTILFVAGSEEDEVLAAAGHGADAIVIDLEEPRTPYSEREREATRQRMRAFFDGPAAQAGSPRWFVRVQPPDTGQTLKDLRAVMGPNLAGVLLPKVYGPEDVYRLDSLLTCLEAEVGQPLGSTVVYPILETAQSLRLAYDIAVASPRVAVHGGCGLPLRRHPPGARLPLDRGGARDAVPAVQGPRRRPGRRDPLPHQRHVGRRHRRHGGPGPLGQRAA